uniref:Uncharacterized protein n=1 Tax=Clytia hemisphaerica TaxID=252671 RepID=A0A7M5V829_9CNID
MGCWVAILGTLDRLNRIHSIISIASAVDTMYHRFKEFSEDEKNTIKQQGYWIGPKTGSVFGYNFLQSCIDNTLMTVKEKQIQIYCPIRILHGMSDDVVPYQVSLKLSKMISSNDIEVHLVKHFDHMMNSDEALALLSKVLDEMVKVGLDSDVYLQAPSKL